MLRARALDGYKNHQLCWELFLVGFLDLLGDHGASPTRSVSNIQSSSAAWATMKTVAGENHRTVLVLNRGCISSSLDLSDPVLCLHQSVPRKQSCAYKLSLA
eukprot:2594757-Amphidinium_carterae.2